MVVWIYDKADLEYEINGMIIDKFIAECHRLRAARDVVNESLSGYALCTVRLSERPRVCNVHLEEFAIGRLQAALQWYMSTAGVPDFIKKGSAWDICDNVLAEYGKTTRRSLRRFTQGRWVVDEVPTLVI